MRLVEEQISVTLFLELDICCYSTYIVVKYSSFWLALKGDGHMGYRLRCSNMILDPQSLYLELREFVKSVCSPCISLFQLKC